MPKPTTLSTTAQALLSAAAARADHLAIAPERLPAAARRAVVQSMLKAGLIEEVAADDDQPAWRTTESGERLALRVTEAGLQAVGAEPAETSPEPAHSGPQDAETASAAPQAPEPEEPAGDARAAVQDPGTRLTLRAAAQAVVAAADEEGSPALADAIAALRTALGAARGRTARTTAGTPRAPRTDTKQATVIALLRRPEGASGPQMIEATGWAPHTVRGFLAGLAKKGVTVTVLDRVRQVGSGKQGIKGSYTVYRVAEAG